jgi:hypothetical protein
MNCYICHEYSGKSRYCDVCRHRRKMHKQSIRRAARRLLDKRGLPKAQPIKMGPVVADDDDDDDVPLTMTGGL